MDPASRRFRIALSFPGEHRAYIERVAARLAEELGQERVLYDAYYEAEFARPDLDTYLQDLYHDESDLIALFLCEDYENKDWCRLEWRAVRDLLKRRRTADIMPFRFDMTEIPGLFSTDGYVWIGDRSPEEAAELILQRLELSEPTSALRTASKVAPTRNQRIAPSRLTHSAEKLFGRESELAMLDEAWENPQTHVLTLVAWGGVGKTSLVAKWRAGLAAQDHDGADYFDWSFYSQGTRDQGSPSSDAFIDKALRFFGDEETADSTRSAWDKGARLAELVAQRRTLLMLDGLEPLQYPPGPLQGELKDQGVLALLKGLAGKNSGLCVVTTREPVKDLASFRDSTAPEKELSRLSKAAGVDLLQSLGVKGLEDELQEVVEGVRGHALTLNLLGRYLHAALEGDVRKKDRVRLEEADAEIQGDHAFHVMQAYERWFEEEGEAGHRLLAVLRLLGLFDRPADPGCLAALRKPPAIEGITEPILKLSEAQWNITGTRLEELGLVARDAEYLDAHPLVREYFARRLRENQQEAWKAAHGRLFEHLKDSTEQLPETLIGLQPLYQAVVHGCLAGREQEACDEVYFARINRGQKFFSAKKLGASGADLGAVACFFDPPWSRVSPALNGADQAWLLNQAAFHLRALGRLREAVEPMQAGLEMQLQQENWKNAAAQASNLSELQLTLGEVAAALKTAERGVEYADRGGNEFWRMAGRIKRADALHQAGRREPGLESFREAEAMQAERQSGYPLLYSLRGFQYCDLLLAGAERSAGSRQKSARPMETCKEVVEHAEQTLGWATSQSWLLDIALDHLTLGRARLYRALLEGSELGEAATEIEQAVDGLRQAGTQDHLPRGLLTRAWLRSAQDDADGARADLAEAQQIAERGPMPLFLADVHLYRARLFHDREALAEARRLVDQHGYGRRVGELEDLEAVAGSW